MKVGFTGTRKGMSQAQLGQVGKLLMIFERAAYATDVPDPLSVPPEFHHGGATGADTEADQLACLDGYQVHVHPCPGVVADAPGKFNSHPVIWNEVFPPLMRNQHIVDVCDVLIAAPETDKEVQRSGTWATIRYARKAGKPVVMLSRGKE